MCRLGRKAQEVLLHRRILCELGKSASKRRAFPDAVPPIGVEITHALVNALMQATVGLARTCGTPLRIGPVKAERFRPTCTASRCYTPRRQRPTKVGTTTVRT